ncbi:MAG: response regulator transcription factor [Candidatus Edwardsbacteria bacterium]|nr:response regulator transcription factor [Candidatus Edwardsbacteria bacterium]MBU2464455.1 response regulator transcription factor [Candidatus Edwardsbacteria bacterium]MBU2594387.1 response regulator transcription factor [Candidatus Edwardsbacteria bacterium]
MLNIILVDDHPIVRKGLRQIITEQGISRSIDEASDGSEAMEKISKKKYDIVILDISMPGAGGLDVLKQIIVQYPKLPVLILSMHPEEEYAVRAMRAGAMGYLTKKSAPDELGMAITRITQGRRYITSSLAEQLADVLHGEHEGAPHESLTDREYQILLMIASGKRLKEIAGELTLSPKTVSTYRGRILEKMGIQSNADIVRYAIEHKIK